MTEAGRMGLGDFQSGCAATNHGLDVCIGPSISPMREKQVVAVQAAITDQEGNTMRLLHHRSAGLNIALSLCTNYCPVPIRVYYRKSILS